MARTPTRNPANQNETCEPLGPDEPYAPGDILLLSRPMVGMPAGLYVITSLGTESATLCRTAQNDQGQLCRASESYVVPCDDLPRLTRVEDTAMETYH
jgi:hypothetical protein